MRKLRIRQQKSRCSPCTGGRPTSRTGAQPFLRPCFSRSCQDFDGEHRHTRIWFKGVQPCPGLVSFAGSGAASVHVRAKPPELVPAVCDNTSADFAATFVATNRGQSGYGRYLPTSKEAAVPQYRRAARLKASSFHTNERCMVTEIWKAWKGRTLVASENMSPAPRPGDPKSP
jgi:hypothetical protein